MLTACFKLTCFSGKDLSFPWHGLAAFCLFECFLHAASVGVLFPYYRVEELIDILLQQIFIEYLLCQALGWVLCGRVTSTFNLTWTQISLLCIHMLTLIFPGSLSMPSLVTAAQTLTLNNFMPQRRLHGQGGQSLHKGSVGEKLFPPMIISSLFSRPSC